MKITDNEDTFTVTYRDKCHMTSVISCTCSSFGNMILPCRHIFLIMKHLEMPIVNDALIPDHFKYVNIQSEEEPSQFVNFVQTISISSGSTDSFHSMEGRYRAAKKISDQILDFLVICGEREFREKHRIGKLEGSLIVVVVQRGGQEGSQFETLGQGSRPAMMGRQVLCQI